MNGRFTVRSGGRRYPGGAGARRTGHPETAPAAPKVRGGWGARLLWELTCGGGVLSDSVSLVSCPH